MDRIRVLVVDDSAFMRKVIADLLASDPSIEVLDKARNGKDAVRKVKELKPDVVTMDIEMPEMNGIEALEVIMKEHPTPVVMISSLTQEGASATVHALELGAVDFITKTSGSISLDIHKVRDQIVAKVKAAAKAKLYRPTHAVQHQPTLHTSPQKPSNEPTRPLKNIPAAVPCPTGIPHLIVIGTSTGGPRALQVLLKQLPADLPAALFIVQHMPPGFTKSLSERLDSLSPMRVVEAEDGMVVQKGWAYIAPGNYHMEIRQTHPGQFNIALNQKEPKSGHRPSVDILFESAAQIHHPNKLAIIMTGMGNDGTNGLKLLKSAGCKEVIAEAESTCVVFGMPKAAILSGQVDQVLPLEQIGTYLVKKYGNG